MFLIDTDILIWVLRGKKEYVDLLRHLKEHKPLSVSAITVAEVYKNTFPIELHRTEKILNELYLWDVNRPIARQAGLYWQQFAKQFKNFYILDCIIAATAREHNLELVTLNTRHFPMADIVLYKKTLVA